MKRLVALWFSASPEAFCLASVSAVASSAASAWRCESRRRGCSRRRRRPRRATARVPAREAGQRHESQPENRCDAAASVSEKTDERRGFFPSETRDRHDKFSQPGKSLVCRGGAIMPTRQFRFCERNPENCLQIDGELSVFCYHWGYAGAGPGYRRRGHHPAWKTAMNGGWSGLAGRVPGHYDSGVNCHRPSSFPCHDPCPHHDQRDP